MPRTGVEYLKAMKASIAIGMKIVKDWSDKKGRVAQPYRDELATFWKSAKMVSSNVNMPGRTKASWPTTGSSAWNGDGSFQELVLFFDIAAHNGSLKSVDAQAVGAVIGGDQQSAVAAALAWVASVKKGTAGEADAPKNNDLERIAYRSHAQQRAAFYSRLASVKEGFFRMAMGHHEPRRCAGCR